MKPKAKQPRPLTWREQFPRTLGLILIALLIMVIAVARFWWAIHWSLR